MPHVQLASRRAALSAVRDAVDDERARAADAFATIRIERYWFVTFRDQPLIHRVDHFEERHVRDNLRGFIFDDLAGTVPVFLSPNSEYEIHEKFSIEPVLAMGVAHVPHLRLRATCENAAKLESSNTRSEEHTSELQSRFGLSYAVF